MELRQAYKALKKNVGKLPKDENFKFIAFGGDGGTYDIGFQSYQELWNVVMTWFMCVTITELI